MYYIFGKTDNCIRFDKDNRLALDIHYLMSVGAVPDPVERLLFTFNGAIEEYYMPKNLLVTIDEVDVTNPNSSCFFKKRDLLGFGEDLCIHNGLLVQNPEIYDLSFYFSASFDSNEIIDTFISTQSFFDAKFPIVTDESTTIGSSLQYLVATPIVKIQLYNKIYDNHRFVLSKQYTLNVASQFKLFCIPLEISTL